MTEFLKLLKQLIQFLITEKRYIKDVLCLIAFTRLLFLERDERALIFELLAIGAIMVINMLINKNDIDGDGSGSTLA